MNRLLLRAMILKELRIMRRDPQQLLGLVSICLSLLLLFTIPVFTGDQIEQQRREEEKAAATRLEAAEAAGVEMTIEPPAEEAPTPLWAFRWSILGTAAGLAFYASFFSVAMALASFAGEKEERTVELLLAAPIRDTTLYVLKLVSVTLVTSLLGYLFLLVSAAFAVVYFWDRLGDLPASLLVSCALLSLPLPILITGLQVSLGAMCSVRADTTKGAGQVYGGAISIILVGLPVLVMALGRTSLGDTATRLFFRWVEAGAILQVASLYSLLIAICAGCFFAGWSMFRRERLLT
jgi:ABC-2 family transporter protein